MNGKGETSNIVKIAGALGGIFLVIVIIFLIFAKDMVSLTVPIVWAFVLLGIVLGFFQMLSDRRKK